MARSRMLYKYRSLSGQGRDYTARILRDRRLYYAAPGQFNDPFDCRFQVSMEGALTDDGKKRESEIRAFTENWLGNEKNNDVCVLSLSGRNNHTLMWSHYADCHKGICIGLRIPTDNELHRVKYGKQPAYLLFKDLVERTRDESRFHDSIIGILTKKATHWRYEMEWRCIDFEGKGERPLPETCLSEVILGCRTTDDDREQIREWLSGYDREIPIRQARMKDREFGLEVVSI